MVNTRCLGCRVLKNKGRRFHALANSQLHTYSLNDLRRKNGTPIPAEEDVSQGQLCHTCFQYISEHQDLPLDDSAWRMGQSSHHCCTFKCAQLDVSVKVVIPFELHAKLLMEYKFVALEGSRMCSSHITTDDFRTLVNQVNTPVHPDQYPMIMELQREYYNRMMTHSRILLDMDDIDSIEESKFQKWIGYSKQEFDHIVDESDQDPKKLAVFLAKLRTNLSSTQLGTLFGISGNTVSRYMASTIDKFKANIINKYINTGVERTDLINHMTPMASTLFDVPSDKAMVIFDGTYRYEQKSANYKAQRQDFSGQKNRNLYKVMVGICTDGYVSHVFGPYMAKHNDLEDCFNRHPTELSNLVEGDYIMADRGFRDCVEFLEGKGFHVKTPAMKSAQTSDGKQLDTKSANESRLVTKIRYIIELIFGILKKKFKYFDGVAHNSTLIYDLDILQCCFALMNMFHEPIITDVQYPGMVERIKARYNQVKDQPNKLGEMVKSLNLTKKRVSFEPLNDVSEEFLSYFPQLTRENLHFIAGGSYQLQNAISYYGEHKSSPDGTFHVSRLKPPNNFSYAAHGIQVTNPVMIRAKMHSRFKNGGEHHLFVLADNDKEGEDAIAAYYCTCEAGNRTLGCCSHIMTVVWYLGRGHSEMVVPPNPNLHNLTI